MLEEEFLTTLNERAAKEQYETALDLETKGSHQDLFRAALLFIRSAESGYKPAKKVFYFDFNTKGHMHVTPNRLAVIENAAKMGYVDAQYSIGCRYRKGLDVRKDYDKAFFWFTKAADNGHLGASYYLGKMYMKGRGTNPDPELAIEHIVDAGDRDYPEAQHDIGKMYESGSFFKRDLSKAFGWYLRSAYNGYFMSVYRVGEMYRDGLGVEQSGTNAISWFKKSGNIGYTISWYSIAKIYEDGCAEVKPDIEKALHYYKEAEKRG